MKARFFSTKVVRLMFAALLACGLLALVALSLSGTTVNAAPLRSYGDNPQLRLITVTAGGGMVVFDTQPYQAPITGAKTVYFKSAATGLVTVTLDVTGTAPLTVTRANGLSGLPLIVSAITAPLILPMPDGAVVPLVGNYNVTFTLQNDIGDSTVFTLSFAEDRAPTGGIVSPTAGTVLTKSAQPTYPIVLDPADSGSGLQSVWISTGAGGAVQTGLTYDWPLPTEDNVTHTLLMTATDYVDNVTTATRVVTVDTQAPAAATPLINNGVAWTPTSTLVFTWTPSIDQAGILRYELLITDSNGVTQQAAVAGAVQTYTLTTASEGVGYRASLRAVDQNSNVGPWSAASMVITPDLHNPVVEYGLPPVPVASGKVYPLGATIYYSDSTSNIVRVEVTATDTLSLTDVTASSAPNGWDFISKLSSAPNAWRFRYEQLSSSLYATNLVTITGQDASGRSASRVFTFTVDGASPLAAVINAPAYFSTTSGSNITLTYRATDTLSGLNQVVAYYSLNGGATWTLTTQSKLYGAYTPTATDVLAVPVAGLPDGVYAWKVVATDNLGNTPGAPTGSGDMTTTYDTHMPTLSITAPSDTGASPINVNWTASDSPAGLQSVTLWVQNLPSHTWGIYTATATSAPTGALAYSPAYGDGTYDFYVQAADKADNSMALPVTPQASTIYGTGLMGTQAAATAVYTNVQPLSITWVATSTVPNLNAITLCVSSALSPAWQTIPITTLAGTISQANGVATYTPPADDLYYFAIGANTRAGQQRSCPITTTGVVSITYDTHAPLIDAVTVLSDTGASPINVNWSASDNLAGLQAVTLWVQNLPSHTWGIYTATATSAPTGALAYSPAYGDGTYDFYVQAADKADNSMALPVTPQASTIYGTGLMGTQAAATAVYTNVQPLSITWVATSTVPNLNAITLCVSSALSPAWQTIPITTLAGTISQANGVATYTPPADDLYYFAIGANTRAGQQRSCPITTTGVVSITYDTHAPLIDAVTVLSDTGASPINVNWSASDNLAGLQAVTLWAQSLPSHTWGIYTATATSAPSGTLAYSPTYGDGVYDFYVQVADKAGNGMASPVNPQASTLYGSGPLGAQASAAVVYTNVRPLAVTWVATSTVPNLKAITLCVSSALSPAWQTIPITTLAGTISQTTGVITYTPPADDLYYFEIGAISRAGQQRSCPITTTGAVSITYDTQISAPISLTVTPAGWTNLNAFTLDWNNPADLSGISSVKYLLGVSPTITSVGTSVGLTPTAVVTAPNQGSTTLWLWLEDRAGNSGYTRTQSVTLLYDSISPTVVLTLPRTFPAHQAVVAWAGNDAQSGLVSYTLAYQGSDNTGNSYTLAATETAKTISVVYGKTYTFTLTAYDGAGNYASKPGSVMAVSFKTQLPLIVSNYWTCTSIDAESNNAYGQAKLQTNWSAISGGQKLTVSGNFCPTSADQYDYFRITTTGNFLTLKLTVPTGANLNLYGYDQTGTNPVVSVIAPAGDKSVSVPLAGGGTYYLEVRRMDTINQAHAKPYTLEVSDLKTLSNGSFEEGAGSAVTDWTLTNANLPATPVASVSDGTALFGSRAILLGDPSLACRGGIPLGHAEAKQTFFVPNVSQSLNLKYRYVIFTQDTVATTPELGAASYDRFEVYVEVTAPNVQLVASDANTTSASKCSNPIKRVPGAENPRSPLDGTWAVKSVSLDAYKGQFVTVYFRNYSRFDNWYNTYTYLDKVELVGP